MSYSNEQKDPCPLSVAIYTSHSVCAIFSINYCHELQIDFNISFCYAFYPIFQSWVTDDSRFLFLFISFDIHLSFYQDSRII